MKQARKKSILTAFLGGCPPCKKGPGCGLVLYNFPPFSTPSKGTTNLPKTNCVCLLFLILSTGSEQGRRFCLYLSPLRAFMKLPVQTLDARDYLSSVLVWSNRNTQISNFILESSNSLRIIFFPSAEKLVPAFCDLFQHFFYTRPSTHFSSLNISVFENTINSGVILASQFFKI